MYVCMHVYVYYICKYVYYIYIHTYICIYANFYVCVYNINMYIHMYIYICMHIFTRDRSVGFKILDVGFVVRQVLRPDAA